MLMATYEWTQILKGNNILWKLPRNIRLNDNIVVREDEIAVFYRDGKALAYLSRPDRYALTSLDVPYAGKIVELLTGIRQDAEVYYLQKKPFDAKFGSKQPYVFRDKEFGLVNLRLSGELRWRINEPANFINQFVGTEGMVSNDQIQERIKEQIVVSTFDALGELKEKGMSVADIPANLLEIEQIVIQKSKPHFSPYGIEIQKITSIYITMPDEVQTAINARTSMNITGTGYTQYQSAQAMREAAVNPAGGAAGTGVGVGAGMAMGWQMSQAMMQPPAQQQQQPQPPPAKSCVKCGAAIPPGQLFCGQCGTKQAAGTCPKCGSVIVPGNKFCGNCGNPTS
jgi:membrane protease subunit (stomatin/prohibitin family)